MVDRLIRIAFVAAVFFSQNCAAWSDDTVFGKWRDNAPQSHPMGNLEITKTEISLGRNLVYRLEPIGPFKSGLLFAVIGINRSADPQGCGPTGKIHFIGAIPLPPVVGTRQQALRLFFFAGDNAPDPDTIDDNPLLCAVHPFGRK